ncbi:DMSO/TMAO reductase YedYZ molybdopterin-dependent catalytic subunit [Bacillus mesophilus]|uniref:Sulfite oxidase-like oxidoreductase n=1 Tax=Bacillus mesophilus TaxID=1808955 RepID=A0A6M0Q6V6_9BACI|nr:sulfite oxidase-like oxidoreductase [Bacillus mesophilus]MBM7661401.1 DMSO/TMAO reductase YedYZ molybdopterin-dependent catalytic subunit [Bacillus mesophilus]NEY72074.1 sulfite oxidase-like oxidoreductase [Bacillus mesophilus]
MYFGKPKNQHDQTRVPPNQNVTTTFPVLHHGNVPYYKKDLSDWDLKIYGLVEQPVTYTFKELQELAAIKTTNDIHCVTGWSKLDNQWEGFSTKVLLKKSGVLPEAKYVMIHAEEGWSTNVPIQDFMRDTSMLAHSHNGEPLSPEHGYPLRVVIPHLYFWKSAKWVRGIELVKEEQPGFWEKNGYHMYGDPWKEQRFTWD